MCLKKQKKNEVQDHTIVIRFTLDDISFARTSKGKFFDLAEHLARANFKQKIS